MENDPTERDAQPGEPDLRARATRAHAAQRPQRYYADGTPVGESPAGARQPHDPLPNRDRPPEWPRERPGERRRDSAPSRPPAIPAAEAAPVVPAPVYDAPEYVALYSAHYDAPHDAPHDAPRAEPQGYVPVQPVPVQPPPVDEPVIAAPPGWRQRLAQPIPAARLAPYAARVRAGALRLRDDSLIRLKRLRRLGAASPLQAAPPAGADARPAWFPALYMYVRAAHVLLAVGLIALGLSLSLPWATNAHGLPLYLRDFTSPKLAQAGVPVAGWAISAASTMVFWGACLGILLIASNIGAIALNVSAYRANLPGCLAGLLTPVITFAGVVLLLDLALMTGFGLLGLLSQLPGLYAAGMTNQVAARPAPGVFLWWAGVLLSFMGTVGQMNMRTRIL